MNDLKAKLKWYIDTIEFYLKPDELASAIRQEKELVQVRQKLENLEQKLGGPGSSQSLWLIVLSEDLKAKFEEGLATRKPSWLTAGSPWPLNEGFQAFNMHYGYGTVNIASPSGADDTQDTLLYLLNLTKAVFILTKLKEVPYLVNVGTESVWNYQRRDAEEKIKAQVHRFKLRDLKMPSPSVLLRQPDEWYWLLDIENEGENEEVKDASVTRLGEELVLKVNLSPRGRQGQLTLLVFREGTGREAPTSDWCRRQFSQRPPQRKSMITPMYA